ncbi:hypothetical protein [Neorhizobium galegae]|uniref:hypothetical protein n=1 Tax=Neorhizobium galegae TaxID=399 RepID=UPI001245CC92|nr:hypothetical protein [Neorhizobium galegae]
MRLLGLPEAKRKSIHNRHIISVNVENVRFAEFGDDDGCLTAGKTSTILIPVLVTGIQRIQVIECERLFSRERLRVAGFL